MTGVQGRRTFAAGLASSARRGAHVPSGAPGVYRVPRRRVVSVQGDTGAPGSVEANPWVQPEDQEKAVGVSYVGAHLHLDHATDGEVIVNETQAAGFPPYFAGGRVAQTDSANFRYEAGVAFFDIAGASLDPWEPDPGDWPSGATGVEFENPEGVRTADPIRVAGTFYQSVQRLGGTVHTVWGQEVRRYLEAGYTLPGGIPAIPGVGGPSDPDVVSLYGGSVLESWAPIAAPGAPGTNTLTTPFDFTVGDEDSTGWLALMVRSQTTWVVAAAEVSAVGWVEGGDMTNNLTQPVQAYVSYTPPRYRFTF